ncbi:hypothetical protein BSKO_07616 [Bryopsis sp. KO-2023]|nr:hypothetical protein BSKO_07616 [Bryopsis sp. KO-2023]
MAEKDVEAGFGARAEKRGKVRRDRMAAVLAYALCSSTMLLINKVAVHSLPAPSFVLICQLGSASAFVYGMAKGGWIESDKLETKKARAFLPAALSFLGVIYTNIKVLQYANVETFIVFRCSTPLLLSVCDFLFLNRELPSRYSWLCLLGILFSAIGYVASDSSFQLEALIWIFLWYIVFLFEMTYLKHLCDTVEMTNWGRVFYNNYMALFPLLCVGLVSREDSVVAGVEWTAGRSIALILSCLVGIGMSYTSFWLRNMVSATAFTVIGIMCKIGTVILNYLYWDQHASTAGIGCLMIW